MDNYAIVPQRVICTARYKRAHVLLLLSDVTEEEAISHERKRLAYCYPSYSIAWEIEEKTLLRIAVNRCKHLLQPFFFNGHSVLY